jgi:transposase InsO family protein
LLDSFHSGAAHLKDNHATISQKYCGVPRKAVRLFAAKCHVCNRVDTKKRNKRPPRAIVESEVRQRYTLDLIDLLKWQQNSTDEGHKKRYVAHMIDYSSKLRWAEPIANKTAALVLEMVRRVFKDFGHPAILHTDNGTEFANTQLEEECRRWGTRIIHGRPYHPESQGVVERANGVLQQAMRKYQRSNPTQTDWTFVLSQVMWTLNSQVHSVTSMAPQYHFQHFNHFSRQVRGLAPGEPVVITVAQLASIPSLQWVQPCEVMAYDQAEPELMSRPESDSEGSAEDSEVDEKAMVDVETVEKQVEQTAKAVEPSGMRSDGEGSEEGDVDEEEKVMKDEVVAKPVKGSGSNASAAVPPTSISASTPRATSFPPVQSHRTLRQRSTVVDRPTLTAFSILPPGLVGEFIGPEWDRDLVPQVRAWLRRVGSIANGDCGPASAYFVQHGKAATERQAAQVRSSVFAWSNTAAGQLYYAEHLAGELQQQPGSLSDMQVMWSEPRCWVTPEFMTCFGGMTGQSLGQPWNIFLLSRSVSLDSSVHVGIRLVTNGGLLIQTDEANCCCIYFQYRSPEQIGHFEPVRDKQGRYQWRVDDQAVRDCLWKAMQRTKMARSVRDMRKKQLVAAHNRVNLSNETFQVGDCAWLIVPPEVVDSVMAQLKRKRDKINAADGKLLVKIGRIITHDDKAGHSPLPTQHFAVWTEDGPIESTFSIDQLQRCHPPPEASTYRVVDLQLPAADTPAPRVKKLKLSKAYKRYLTLYSARTAVATMRQVNAAVDVATSINSRLNNDVDMAGSLVSLSEAAAAPSLLTAIADKPMTPPPESNPPSPKPRVEVDLVSYPCTHCGETLEFSDCSFCFYSACRAPFHQPGTGCGKEGKVFVVNKVMLYCRPSCASLDIAKDNRFLAQMQQPAPSTDLRPDVPEVDQDITQSQSQPQPQPQLQPQLQPQSQPLSVESGTSKPPVVCKSCQQPLLWKHATGCDKCQGYHHKLRKNQEGCTREGWSKGGSRNVDGSVECVACRFTADADWRRFCEQAG